MTAGIRGCVPVSILLLCKCWWQLAHEMERVLLMSSEVLVHGHTGSVVSPQSTAGCGRGEWTDSRSQSPLHLAQSSVHRSQGPPVMDGSFCSEGCRCCVSLTPDSNSASASSRGSTLENQSHTKCIFS